MHEVTCLGHKCTDHGILSDEKKYDVIQNYPTPTDTESAQRYVIIIEDSLTISHSTRVKKKCAKKI